MPGTSSRVECGKNAATPRAFDVGVRHRYAVDPWELYQCADHYRPVIDLGAARIARSSQDLAAYVNLYLSDPSLDRENRRKLVELQVAPPFGVSSSRILTVLEQIGQ